MLRNSDYNYIYRSPMFIGANYVIDREFFFSIGAFDESMLYWGSENIDLAIRVINLVFILFFAYFCTVYKALHFLLCLSVK